MSIPSRPSKQLFVEGSNDLHFVIHLIKKLRPAFATEAKTWFGGFNVNDCNNDAKAIEAFALATKGSTDNICGLILDADDTDGKRISNRWASIRQINTLSGTEIPLTPPGDGWIGKIPSGPKVGVWIMPDNAGDGALEGFIGKFVPQNNLWAYADSVVDVAKNTHQAPFSERHKEKARLHSWLAWCSEPGRPYGRAMECGDLDPRLAPEGELFVTWVEKLFS